MLPYNGLDLTEYTEPQLSPSYSWKVDPNRDKIAGFVDDLDSVQQACYMMLRTELGKYEIYPEDYGIELNDLYGLSRDLVSVRLPNRIEECLMTDRRIEEVGDIDLEFVGSQCRCRFTVRTIFGEFEDEVSYDLS